MSLFLHKLTLHFVVVALLITRTLFYVHFYLNTYKPAHGMTTAYIIIYLLLLLLFAQQKRELSKRKKTFEGKLAFLICNALLFNKII